MSWDFDRRHFIATLGAVASAPLFPVIARGAAAAPPRALDAWREPKQIEFGADYYAEDWPSGRLEIDVQLMARARFTAVRMADTNWERLEPSEGRYSFAWLDRALDVLNRHGIRGILCTSSYAPPAWLVAKHPSIYLVNEAGVRHPWGGMGFLCLNNPIYRQYVEKLVTALALHYGKHPGIIGWQIDNELGYWGTECYDTFYCLAAFRKHLKEKFGTLSELNRRLLTVSYGHEYSSWDQINLRVDIHDEEDALQVPLVLEAKRFFSQNLVRFVEFQAKTLRRHTSGQFITHNGPNPSNNVFDFARPLDFLSEDIYPLTGQFANPPFFTDLMRGTNKGKTFQVLEMRSGTYGSYTLNDPTPPPGLARLWAWQTIAHGSDGTLFFRWRRNNGGSEPYWQGLLGYDGTPAPPYAEIVRMGEELKQHGARLAGASSPAAVAGLVSYDSYWGLNIGHKDFPYFDELTKWVQAFRRLQLNVDLIEPASDLSQYRIIFAPALYIVDAALAERLAGFVNGGGVLIIGPRAGFANQDYVTHGTPPGALHSLAQIQVDNFTVLKGSDSVAVPKPNKSNLYTPTPTNSIRSSSEEWPGSFQAGIWADILTLTGAETLYSYQEDFYAGQPAITMAATGKGKTVYVGTLLEESFYPAFAERICKLCNLPHEAMLPAAIDFAVREKQGSTFRFLLNFGREAQVVTLAGDYGDLLSGKQFSGSVDVPALDLRILAQSG